MSGRPKKPTNLKILEGNPGKRDLNAGEPKPKPVAPERPSWITGAARKEWERLAPELENMGLLTSFDMAAFAAYCQAYAVWQEAERKARGVRRVTETPNGFAQASAWETIAKQRFRDMMAAAKEFGFTPVSRTKVSVPKQAKENEFEKLLSR